MTTSLYQERILDHYKFPRNSGEPKQYDKKVSASNTLCGDEITLFGSFKGKKVKKLSHMTQGCAISKASASLLCEYSAGKTKDQLRKLDQPFMIKMLGIKLGPNRVKCAMLALEALHALLV